MWVKHNLNSSFPCGYLAFEINNYAGESNKGSPAYLVYIPETGKVMKYRVVKFPMTTKGMEQQTQTVRPLPDDDDDGDPMSPPHSVSDVDRSEKVPDRLAEQPQAESETSPTCQPPNEGFRRSTRTRRSPAYLRGGEW